MKNILGIDGSKSGWVGVKQSSKQEGTLEILFKNKLIDFLSPDIDLIIIDMPVGLDKNIQQGGRLVDKEARKRLLKRKSSIFNAPIRDVLKAKSYNEANTISKNKGLGISKQSWNLIPKINELDQILQIKILIINLHKISNKIKKLSEITQTHPSKVHQSHLFN